MNKLMGATVIFSLFFIALFLILLVNFFVFDFTLLGVVFHVILVISCAGFVIASLNIYFFFLYRQHKIDEHNQYERNVRDYYRYKKLIELPSMDT